eukprot:8398527-Karenia_brevis.AAC.1
MDPKLRQFWGWHVRRYIGRRQFFQDRAEVKIERLLAEETHRVDNQPSGAYLSPTPTPTTSVPVRLKPFAKSMMKEINRAKSSVSTPSQ